MANNTDFDNLIVRIDDATNTLESAVGTFSTGMSDVTQAVTDAQTAESNAQGYATQALTAKNDILALDLVEEAPDDGNEYVRKEKGWVQNVGGGGGIIDAPNDNHSYLRGQEDWNKLEAGTNVTFDTTTSNVLKISASGDVAEAPDDGSYYLRNSKAWSEVEAGSGINLDTSVEGKLVVEATGGTGTVTSVGLSVPTGLSVSNSPITSSGNISVSFAQGYSIPLDQDQSNWDTAYGWGNHATEGYVKATGNNSQYITGAGNLYSFPSIPSKTSDLNNDSDFIPEAPDDGKAYARKNKDWEEVQSGGGSGGIPELDDPLGTLIENPFYKSSATHPLKFRWRADYGQPWNIQDADEVPLGWTIWVINSLNAQGGWGIEVGGSFVSLGAVVKDLHDNDGGGTYTGVDVNNILAQLPNGVIALQHDQIGVDATGSFVFFNKMCKANSVNNFVMFGMSAGNGKMYKWDVGAAGTNNRRFTEV